ncbi:phenazine biosynthesis protein PhzF [Nocardioides sp. S5]|uniref:PhzF family phenazine biosynthesis protein n=1 Tax=Nocardioides sp. S5 TaxID=2017486 RepID=UPI001A8D516D|nr:PhzF family phenazine biosynthesis protein [Nocardioides sp. S5]QSR31541.1 phenazine biosynthesis protein PhzF [Nocardioides sp. S5]
MLPFRQVDVFSAEPWLGNPLAVVHDAEGVSDEQMAHVARWTNLSETTFLCAPTDDRADYRVRIWTPTGELPFAGHPTIGSAHAWLEAGGAPRDEVVVQECGAGLVDVRRSPRLGFAAPPLRRSGPVDADLRARIVRALAISDAAVQDMAWIDNGPGWVGVDLATAQAVLDVVPDIAAFTDLKVTVLGRWDAARAADLGADVEVRAFYADGRDFGEDPVTGSANAGLAQWLIDSGALPSAYTSRQGSVIGCEGRVRIEADGDQVWVSGDAVTRVVGEVDLG